MHHYSHVKNLYTKLKRREGLNGTNADKLNLPQTISSLIQIFQSPQ
ncbi:hypothetical protein CHCC20491_2820 [Bacillus paralicheniformis]|nr:hypothetical protein CHCC20491_2820 [Bacillus paralicheniformis]